MNKLAQTIAFVLAAATAIAWASVARANPPASAPDLMSRELKAVSSIAAESLRRKWGPAIIETFDKAPDKNPWQCVNGKIRFADGKMIVEPTVQSQAVVYRAMPEAIKDAQAIQVVVWLQADPMMRKIGAAANARVFSNLYASLWFSHDVQGIGQYDYNYVFASGGNGMMQSFRMLTDNVKQNFGDNQAVAPGKLVQVTLQLAGNQAVCKRDKFATSIELGSPSTLNEKTRIGLTGMFSQLHIAKITYRGLAPLGQENDLAAMWKKTPFADEKAFTQHLRARLIPELNSPQYARRQQAHELITSLWPLSRAAVQEASKTASAEETRERLESLLEAGNPVRLGAPPPDDEAAKPPTNVKEMKLTTQPADNAPVRNAPIRGKLVPMPAPMLN
ncbi:MAG: hypothetical protein PHU85_07305 [Phycisphaerae bacterium]|nr:hypothetical protein [Phycisphaerae bacterium]